MGMGSYAVLKFDPLLILIKNIICSFYIIGFIFELKLNKSLSKSKTITQIKQGNKYYIRTIQKRNKCLY